ncbi:SMP-30/gluconolactonase/LRE family protein [Adhaeribacter radiodurans]|uniref:SMP-30/gluconolactonase/LRE family protein n=1 Tax=Adhaeribacter radiodurans TaxID=2745197 RepID=A0A7L7L4H4_9BACT|nr:SMP-30/gluconolactonase/LRE family protein [Adhaeribacter radiodurans]QMU27674.1 SMP-30/gluconolactonase/LRE family protein [Adhaeribacter radiodurans]
MRIASLKSTLLFFALWSVFFAKAQTTYTTIGIIGSSTSKGWDASIPMKPAAGNNPHQWQVTLPLSEGEVKFIANNSWDVNWGNSPFPLGIAIPGGANVPISLAGTYKVTFNNITGDYSFATISYAAPQKRSVQKSLGSQKTGGVNIFPAEAKVQEIFSNGEDFLEGPVMSPDGLLYFSDFSEQTRTGIIWTLNPQTRAYKAFRSPSGMANGLAFDANGDLIVCEQAGGGGRRVTKTNMKTGITRIIAGQYRNKPFNSPNDLSIDAEGRIYFTDPSYVVNDPVEQNLMGVYRIDNDSSVHLVAANVNKPNGIAVSPDQKTLYVVNCDYPGNGNRWFLPEEKAVVKPNGEGSILAFELKEDGSLQAPSKLIEFGNSIAPDGMTVDADGNLYIAVGSRVVVYDPNGTKLSEIKCPQATNLCFGRSKFSKTLFIAGGKSIFMVETNKEGFASSGNK